MGPELEHGLMYAQIPQGQSKATTSIHEAAHAFLQVYQTLVTGGSVFAKHRAVTLDGIAYLR